MPFYKKTETEIMTAQNGVSGPGFELSESTRDQYQFPVDGWYWFENIDQAISSFSTLNRPTGTSASPRQLRQALSRVPYGSGTLRDLVESTVALGDQDLRDWWEFSTSYDRNHPNVSEMAATLGVSSEQVDQLWALALTL